MTKKVAIIFLVAIGLVILYMFFPKYQFLAPGGGLIYRCNTITGEINFYQQYDNGTIKQSLIIPNLFDKKQK
jgi:hypothetical protein